MTRRILGLGFISSLLSFAFPALAATKPTIPCRFSGQKTTFDGKVFTCIRVKVGARTQLQWDSGKLIPVSTPSPTPSPTISRIATPSPSPSPTPTQTVVSTISIPLGKSSDVALNGTKIFFAKNRYGFSTGYIVVRNSDGVIAMSASCTHSGCIVQIQSEGLVCPCHNALFDSKNGDVLRGPAAYPLNRLPVVEVDGTIFVTD